MAKQSKKEMILDIALVHFSQNGFDNSSLEDIAKQCNITKPAIYYHFKDKATLYKEVFLNQLTNLANFLTKSIEKNSQNSCKENLKVYIDVFGKYLIDNPSFGALFSREIADGARRLSTKCKKQLSTTLTILSDILKDGVNQGIFKDENPFMIQLMIVSTLSTYHTTTPLRKDVLNLIDEQIVSFQAEFETVIDSLSQIIIKGLEK